ncbi:MAG: ATP-binding protein [Cyanobacteria bacterium P01_G01_bin.54]
MIFKRYKFIIRFALIAVSLVSLVLFYWQFNFQYQYEVTVFKNRFQEDVAILDNTLKTTTDYVEEIQLQADSFYAMAQVGYTESLLIDGLSTEVVNDLPYYNLDQIPEPYSSQGVGNVTGLGTLKERPSNFYRDLVMAVSLNPILQTAHTIIDSEIAAYYLSTEQFINRSPWMPSSQFRFEPQLLQYEIFTLGKPENNPDRHQFWTAAYLDATNTQTIISCGAPIYERDRFRGTVGLDLKLDALTQILRSQQWPAGQSFLINNRHQVLAYVDTQAQSETSPQLVWSVDEVLTARLQTQIQAIATPNTVSVLEDGTNLIIVQGLHQAPWQLVHILPKTSLMLPLLLRLGTGWGLFLLGLILSLLISDRLIRREFIVPATQLIEHIRSVNQKQIAAIPEVPEDWLPWFETISQIAQANRKMTTQLVQKEKMSGLGQLIAGIAHEINNPVNFIYGNLSYVKSYSQDLLDVIADYQTESPHISPQLRQKLADIDLEFVQQDLQDIVRSMETGAERIRNIVLSLRSFSQLDEMGMKQVDLNQGLENTLLVLDNRLAALKVHKDYGEIPTIQGYASQLNQVFVNLLNNAIDAVQTQDGEPKTITITTRSVCSTLAGTIAAKTSAIEAVQIAIADNGRGMTPKIQAHSLDPFFTTKPVGQGTGLGLPICYQIIVEQHYGELSIESQPDLGTTVMLTLPVAPPALRCDLPLPTVSRTKDALTKDSPPA